MGLTLLIKNTRLTSNEVEGRHEERIRELTDYNREEWERMEIQQIAKVVVPIRK